MQNQRKYQKQACRFRHLNNWVGVALGLGCTWILGCTGPQRHPELKEDRSIVTRQWTFPTHSLFEAGDHGTEYSNPVIIENNLVFGNRSTGIISLYPGFNLKRWDLPIRGGVVSELTVHRGAIYFGGGDGFLYSVDLESGHINWKVDVKNPILSRPTIEAGRLFVTASNDVLYAFDAGTGKWLWHYRRSTPQRATILGASTPLVDGNQVIAGMTDGYLVGLSLDDGQLKWEKKIHTGSKFTDVDAHPVLENGKIYIPSYDGALYSLNRASSSVSVNWRFDAGGSKQVVLEGDRVYLPSSDGSIYCLKKQNAKVLWKFDLDGGVPTRLAVTERYLIFGSSYQYLYILNKDTGEAVYRFNSGYGSGFSGSPAYDSVSGKFYFLSGAGNLYAFKLRR